MMLPSLHGLSKLPADATIRIEGRGDKPAMVIIEQGDERWESTADKLSELPQAAQKLLYGDRLTANGSRALPLAPSPGIQIRELRLGNRDLQAEHRKAIETMKRQLDEMREKLEKLEQDDE